MSPELLEDTMDIVQKNKKLPGLLLLILLATLVPMVSGQCLAQSNSGWKLDFSLKDPSLNTALPTALFADQSKKRYYVVDSQSGRLASFDHEGVFLKTFSPEGGLSTPFDMVRLSGSTLLITEKGENSLTSIDFKQKKTSRNIIQRNSVPLLVDRVEIAGQTLYISDRQTGQIYRLSPELKIEQSFPLPKTGRGIIDFKIVDQQVWGLDQIAQKIYVYSLNGRLVKQIDLTDLVAFPVSIAINKNGSIYVLDRHLGEVIVLDRKAKLKYRFLSKGHGPHNLYYPIEIQFDPWGRLCIVDEGNSRIQVFNR